MLETPPHSETVKMMVPEPMMSAANVSLVSRTAGGGAGGEADAAADDDMDTTPLGNIPQQLLDSTESDTVRFRISQPDDVAPFSPEHGRGNLFSPTFDGTEVTYSRSRPPVPSALRRLSQDGGAEGAMHAVDEGDATNSTTFLPPALRTQAQSHQSPPSSAAGQSALPSDLVG